VKVCVPKEDIEQDDLQRKMCKKKNMLMDIQSVR
jgi:hypothetical protein